MLLYPTLCLILILINFSSTVTLTLALTLILYLQVKQAEIGLPECCYTVSGAGDKKADGLYVQVNFYRVTGVQCYRNGLFVKVNASVRIRTKVVSRRPSHEKTGVKGRGRGV